jgi:hypothetical protein
MRKAIILLALGVASCSRQTPEQEPAATRTERAAPAPDVAPTLLPGVALTYAYGFVLPAARIAQTQEQHASQCEALGPTRCRITGLKYHVSRHNVTGRLALKLAPDIARRFGRAAVDTVAKNDGMLSDTLIESVDAGATVAAADRDAASVANEQREIAQQLSRPGLSAAERTQLQQRAQALHDSQRQVAASRADAVQLLASTPMTIDYESGTVDPGLSDGKFVAALKDGWANVMAGGLVLLTVTITLLPWLFALALIVWLWRLLAPRIPRRDGDD